MPMAGKGTRFPNYKNVKPLININKMKLYETTLKFFVSSHNLNAKLTFVIRENEELGIHIESRFPGASLIELKSETRGALETLKYGIDQIQNEDPILSLDCDLMVQSDAFHDYLKNPDKDLAALITFNSNKPIYSYIKKRGETFEIKEKEAVSNHAIAGAYLLPSKRNSLPVINRILESSDTVKGEYYVSMFYNEWLRKGGGVKIFSSDNYVSYGTENELKENKELIDTLQSMI